MREPDNPTPLEIPKKRPKGCWRWGCGLSAAVLVLLVAAWFALFQYGKSSAGPSAEAYLALVTQAEYSEAYNRVSYDWKRLQTLEEFSAFHEAIWSRLGVFRTGKVTGVNIATNPQGTFAQLAYAADFSESHCDIILSLEKIGGAWVVRGAQYNAEVLKDLYRCSKCSAHNQPGATYCSRCGAPLNPSTPSSPGGGLTTR